MARDTDDEADEASGYPELSRRGALVAAGAGVGLTSLGSVSGVFDGSDGGQVNRQQSPTESPGGTATANESAGADTVIDDLVDPTFGYPLAADETERVTLEHAVDATIEGGAGVHPDFPSEPAPDAPGSFVEIPAEFFFDPVGLHVEPGDLVHFNDVEGLHTVTAFHELAEPDLPVPRRVPEDVPAFTSPPLTPGQSWVYEFTERGVYDYLCLPHLGLGMVGRIVVFDPDTDSIEDAPFQAPTAGPLFPNDERVLSAPELDPATIVDRGEVAWADLTIAEPTPTATPTGTETETETGTPTGTETETGTGTETPTGTETETGGG